MHSDHRAQLAAAIARFEADLRRLARAVRPEKRTQTLTTLDPARPRSGPAPAKAAKARRRAPAESRRPPVARKRPAAAGERRPRRTRKQAAAPGARVEPASAEPNRAGTEAAMTAAPVE